MISRRNYRGRMAALGAAVVLASVMMASPALAHGHGHGHHRRSGDYYQSQTTENQAGAGNQAAGSQAAGSGNQAAGSQAAGSGNQAAGSQAAGSETQAALQCPVCTFDGCVEAGRHWHDDVEYCGYHHTSGYCDNSCINDCGYAANGSCTVGPGCHHGAW